MTALASDLIGSTPAKHTRAVTLALLHTMRELGALPRRPKEGFGSSQVELEAGESGGTGRSDAGESQQSVSTEGDRGSFGDPSDRVPRAWTVACSGGPDSLALTFAAADLGHRHQIPVTAVIVDHQMRSESSREAAAASSLLNEWGIKNQVVPATVSNEGGLEAAAREARYQILKDLTPAGGLILLGHTMDDQAETVLLGLGRGSGTRSLSGMREVVEDPDTGHVFIRPLLSVRRFDTEGMCAELGLNPIEDPSNAIDGPWTTADGRPLPRVAVRHRVIPELSAALGRDVVPLLARSAELLDRDASALEQIANEYDTAKRGSVLDVKELAKLAPAIRTRILIDEATNQGSGALEASHVDALDKLVTDYRGGGPIHLPNGVRAIRQKITVEGATKSVIKILKSN